MSAKDANLMKGTGVLAEVQLNTCSYDRLTAEQPLDTLHASSSYILVTGAAGKHTPQQLLNALVRSVEYM